MKKKATVLTGNFTHRSSVFGGSTVLVLEFCTSLYDWHIGRATDWRPATASEYEQYCTQYPNHLPTVLTIDHKLTEVRWISALFGRRMVVEIIALVANYEQQFLYGFDSEYYRTWVSLDMDKALRPALTRKVKPML